MLAACENVDLFYWIFGKDASLSGAVNFPFLAIGEDPPSYASCEATPPHNSEIVRNGLSRLVPNDLDSSKKRGAIPALPRRVRFGLSKKA